MENKYVLTAGLVLMGFALSAQTFLEDVSGKVILKSAPLSLYDVTNTFQTGIEIPFPNARFSFQQELGYGHSAMNVWLVPEGSIKPQHNVKSRTQLRFYYKDWVRGRGYLAGEVFFRNSVIRDKDWIGVGCGGINGCNYFEEKAYSTRKTVLGLHMKMGWQVYFANRVTLDMFVGGGLRRRTNRSLTPGVDRISGGNWWWRDTSRGTHGPFPSLACGFNVGIWLGKRVSP